MLCAGFHIFWGFFPFFFPQHRHPAVRQEALQQDGWTARKFLQKQRGNYSEHRKVLFEHCTTRGNCWDRPCALSQEWMELESLEWCDPGRCPRADSTHCTSAICSGSDNERLNAIKTAWDRDSCPNFHLQSGKAHSDPREGEERHHSGCRPEEPEFHQFSVS